MMEVCNTLNQAAATCSASADSHGSNLKRKFKRRPRSDIGRKHEKPSRPRSDTGRRHEKLSDQPRSDTGRTHEKLYRTYSS